MKLGIMQPYFMPYIGYFQLIASVNKFVIYDNIKYTKKGWINRNRMLQNGSDKIFSIPVAKSSNQFDIIDKEISADFNKQKLLSQLKGCYSKAPYFKDIWPTIEGIILFQNSNLFQYIENSILSLCKHLEIDSEIIASSSIPANHNLSSQDRVLSICKAMNATTYINPVGGMELYSAQEFALHQISLKFIMAEEIEYAQFNNTHVSSLSIIDMLMFNSKSEVKSFLHKYKFI
jgi:hypothetical protein